MTDRQIIALAGGVGGAKLALGLARTLPADRLTVAVNTADDFEHWGLYICPDLDTVTYTLAGIASRYRVSVAQIKEWNGLKRDTLAAGQSCTVLVGWLGSASDGREDAVLTVTADHASATLSLQAQGADSAQASPVEPVRRGGEKVGRNEPCPCGSGKKYKRCHGK